MTMAELFVQIMNRLGLHGFSPETIDIEVPRFVKGSDTLV